MANVDVSVIVVSFNTKKLLGDCLSSVVKFTNEVTLEIIVVDNASTDGSVEFVQILAKKENVQVKLIKNKVNVGFAKANNQGIEVATGKCLLLLNSDTYLIEDAISYMYRMLEKSPSIGIASCALKNEDRSLQPSGGYSLTYMRLLFWLFFIDDFPLISRYFHSYHPKLEYFKNPHEQDWVTGAFFMIRRSVIDDIGMLDPDYFMYVEEMDFCTRARRCGWKVFYDPRSFIVHLGQGSGSNSFALSQELTNIVLFFKKHHPVPGFAQVIIKVGTLTRSLIFAILGKRSKAKIYAQIFSKL